MYFDLCIQRLLQKEILIEGQNPSGQTIERLAIDSREVGSSDCFVALRGSRTDGHLFIDKAVKNGANAIVSEAGPPYGNLGLPGGPAHAQVTNSHRALAELASLLNEDPGQKLKLVAVTGTNGKTTVATLVASILEQSNVPAGFIGTTGYRFGSTSYEASHTTPSAIRVYELLNQMYTAGCRSCAMEASSHALDQIRFRTEDVNVAVFTNLTRDHLDYHGTFESYFQSKKRLFDELPTTSTGVVNLDDPKGHSMASDSQASILSFGQTGAADIRYSIVENTLSGLVLDLDGTRKRFQLAGEFNASNLSAAYAAGLALGFNANEVRDRLADTPFVKGRMESLLLSDGTTLIIDYAHTPDALENVLRTVRKSVDEGTRLWCVFGCGGDRDRGKRPQMGQVAESLADQVVVTNDNPRTEPVDTIMEDIRRGMHNPDTALWIPNRREAIEKTVQLMGAGDTLVLAGKGHETTQVVGTEKLKFDDREEALRAFADSNLTHETGQRA